MRTKIKFFTFGFAMHIMTFAENIPTTNDQSQKKSADEETSGLQTVVISETVPNRNVGQAARKVDVLTAADIENLAGKDTVEILSTIPGITDESGSGQHINVRTKRPPGMTSPAVTFLDGIKLNGLEYGYVNWEMINPALIDRIEVYKSGAPVSFRSPGRGVVAVYTKKAQELPLSLITSFKMGSYGLMAGTANAAFSIKGALQGFVNLNYEVCDEYMVSDQRSNAGISGGLGGNIKNFYIKAEAGHNRAVKNTEYYYFNETDMLENRRGPKKMTRTIYGGLYYHVTNDIKSAFVHRQSEKNITNTWYIGRIGYGNDRVRIEDAVSYRQEQNNYRYNKTGDHFVWYSNNNKWYSNYLLSGGNLGDDETSGVLANRLDVNIFALKDVLTLSTGWEYLKETHLKVQKYTNRSETNSEMDNYSHGVYLSGEFSPIKPLTLNIGGRYDDVLLVTHFPLRTVNTREKGFLHEKRLRLREPSYQAGLNFKIKEHMLYGMYSYEKEFFENSRYADAIEYYYVEGLSSTVINTRPESVRPETVRTTEIGSKGRIVDPLSYDTTLFYGIIQDRLVNVYDDNNNLIGMYNAGKSRMYGAEARLMGKIKKVFSYDASYGFLDHKWVTLSKKNSYYTNAGTNYDGSTKWISDTSRSGVTNLGDVFVARSPRHSFSASATITPVHFASLMLRYTWQEAFWLDELNTERAKTVQNVDARLNLKYTFIKRVTASGYFGVNNIFNELHDRRASVDGRSTMVFPKPGRTWVAGIKVAY